MKKLQADQMEAITGGDCTLAVTALVLTGAFVFLTGGAAITIAGPAIATALTCLNQR